MNTVCHKQLHFGSLFGKEVIADFEGGQGITSDAGVLLRRRRRMMCSRPSLVPLARGPSFFVVPCPSDIDRVKLSYFQGLMTISEDGLLALCLCLVEFS